MRHRRRSVLESSTRDGSKTLIVDMGCEPPIRPAANTIGAVHQKRSFSDVFYTEQITRNPHSSILTDVAAQPRSERVSDVERRRPVRHGEKDGPMADATSCCC
jgi:hypothetical protein